MSAQRRSSIIKVFGGVRMLSLCMAVFLVVAGGLLCAVAILLAGLMADVFSIAQLTNARTIHSPLAVLVTGFIGVGGFGLGWLGILLLKGIPYRVTFVAQEITLWFHSRRVSLPLESLISYRYLFILGGRFTAPGDLVVARLMYVDPKGRGQASCIVLLTGQGPTETIFSPTGHFTELDQLAPEKRIR